MSMAFKSDITAWRRNDLESDRELLWCEFTSSAGQKILFGSYCRPPNTGIEYFELLRESFTATNNKCDKVFLAGDFNLPNFDWINQVPLSSETIYWNAYELLNDAFLTQVNTYPTRNNSILDLVLTTVPDLIDDLYSYQDVVESDHNCISFRIGLSSTDSRPVLKEVFNYKKANFEELKRTLSYVPWNVGMLDDDPNSIVSNWEDLFWAAVDDFVPKKKISGMQVPPWIDAEVKALCRKKDKMSRKALKEKDQVYVDKFKSLRKDVKKLIRLKCNTYIKNLADKVESNPKKFWNFYSCKTKSRRLPPAIRRDFSDADPVFNPTDKANVFNNYFHSVFNHVDNEPPPPGCHAKVSVRECLSHITLPASDVLTTLLHLNP